MVNTNEACPTPDVTAFVKAILDNLVSTLAQRQWFNKEIQH